VASAAYIDPRGSS